MADNYLERKMDDYAKGRLSLRSLSGKRTGMAGLSYPAQRVLIVNGDECEEFMSELAKTGNKICFTVSETCADGQTIAQRTGARFYPITFEAIKADLDARGEHIDGYCGPAEIAEIFSPRVILSSKGLNAKSAAILAAAQLHPEYKG